MYSAVICRLPEPYSHPKGDRISLVKVFGSQVVISKDHSEGDLGVYFPTDGQLSHEFCNKNNLYRKCELNADKSKTGFFEETRRVRTQKFLGEESDGIWLPISCLSFLKFNSDAYKHGDLIDRVGNSVFCEAYRVKVKNSKGGGAPNAPKSQVKTLMFKQHFDTAQAAFNERAIDGKHVIITEKLHGTSGRSALVKLTRKPTLLNKIKDLLKISPLEYWGYMLGTRRVDYYPNKSPDKAYHDPSMREIHHKVLEGKLRKGETFYYELVGFEPDGKAIMESADYSKLGKNFKQFGKSTPFSYGCEEKTSKMYVYRITMTNEDGESVEYSWEDVVKRCEELEIPYVPVLFEGMAPETKTLEWVDSMTKGVSTLDVRHLREGVCVRIGNKIYKHKSFEFKVLEGIIKDAGIPDVEENS